MSSRRELRDPAGVILSAAKDPAISPRTATGVLTLNRFEVVFLSLCLAGWLLVLIDAFGILEVDGLLPMGLYPLYSFAILVGSVAGNAFVFRLRRGPETGRRRLLRLYLAAPPGLILLARAMTRAEDQLATPFVPLYAVLVFAVFFVVPLSIRRPPRRP